MRDPFSWSFPLGRIFGITVRVHFLFPIVAAALILREAFRDTVPPGTWLDAAMLMGLLFFTVFLHELGHCFTARSVGGDAQEVLLWPLGGLANVEVPHNPRAHFLVAFGGPAVNLILCLGCALALGLVFDPALQPTWNPFWYPYRVQSTGEILLTTWTGEEARTANVAIVILVRLFYVSWLGFLLNVLLLAFPLDGGRMFQAVMWHYVGYRQGTQYAIFAGFFMMIAVILFSFVVNDVMPLFLAWFIYENCKQQWLILETGGEDSLFGYDFSQGYTSLERDHPPPVVEKKPGFFQRWLQRRAEKKRQREQERQEADERRMDELLDKIQRQGKEALTDEEHRFLKRVAERYKNRQ